MLNYLNRLNNVIIIMVNTILIEKTSELKVCKYSPEKGDELYKKCKFKKIDNFEKRHTWKAKKNKYSFNYVSVYSRDTGKANTENKYDLPPPVDNVLYFGTIILVAHDDECGESYVDLSIDEWNKFYEELFGGFENLNDTVLADEYEEDELENIPVEMKTKSGYLKDDFVVDDNDFLEGESEGDYSNETSELQYEDYSYSDDE